jgi:hypothetical protein
MNGVIDKILKTKTNKERQIWINNVIIVGTCDLLNKQNVIHP